MDFDLLVKILIIVADVIALILENPKLGMKQAIKVCSKGSAIPESVILGFIKKKK